MDDADDDMWWREGVCAQIGTDLFFVTEGASVAAAKRACGICPVRLKCLADSISSDVEYGVFGGFARDPRRRLTQQVSDGADPMEVARRAIEKEECRASRRPDLQRRPDRRGRAEHRLRPT